MLDGDEPEESPPRTGRSSGMAIDPCDPDASTHAMGNEDDQQQSRRLSLAGSPDSAPVSPLFAPTAHAGHSPGVFFGGVGGGGGRRGGSHHRGLGAVDDMTSLDLDFDLLQHRGVCHGEFGASGWGGAAAAAPAAGRGYSDPQPYSPSQPYSAHPRLGRRRQSSVMGDDEEAAALRASAARGRRNAVHLPVVTVEDVDGGGGAHQIPSLIAFAQAALHRPWSPLQEVLDTPQWPQSQPRGGEAEPQGYWSGDLYTTDHQPYNDPFDSHDGRAELMTPCYGNDGDLRGSSSSDSESGITVTLTAMSLDNVAPPAPAHPPSHRPGLLRGHGHGYGYGGGGLSTEHRFVRREDAIKQRFEEATHFRREQFICGRDKRAAELRIRRKLE